jgi:hypothetical protein
LFWEKRLVRNRKFGLSDRSAKNGPSIRCLLAGHKRFDQRVFR